MKRKFVMMIGCLGIIISSYALGGCGGGSNGTCGSYKNMCQGESFCAGYNGCTQTGGCNCSDPACSQQNDCLSASRCCHAFGNPGAT